SQTRTMDTEIDVENRDGTLVDGMYAETNMVLSQKDGVLTIPIQAVRRWSYRRSQATDCQGGLRSVGVRQESYREPAARRRNWTATDRADDFSLSGEHARHHRGVSLDSTVCPGRLSCPQLHGRHSEHHGSRRTGVGILASD